MVMITDMLSTHTMGGSVFAFIHNTVLLFVLLKKKKKSQMTQRTHFPSHCSFVVIT